MLCLRYDDCVPQKTLSAMTSCKSYTLQRLAAKLCAILFLLHAGYRVSILTLYLTCYFVFIACWLQGLYTYAVLDLDSTTYFLSNIIWHMYLNCLTEYLKSALPERVLSANHPMFLTSSKETFILSIKRRWNVYRIVCICKHSNMAKPPVYNDTCHILVEYRFTRYLVTT